MRRNKQSLITFGFEKIANDEFISSNLFLWDFLSFHLPDTNNVQIGLYFRVNENKDIYDINAFMRRHNITKLLTGNDNYISAIKDIDKNIVVEFHWSYQKRIFIPLKVLDIDEYENLKKPSHSTASTSQG